MPQPRFLPNPTAIQPGHSATLIGRGLFVIADPASSYPDGVKLPTASTDNLLGVTAYNPGTIDQDGNLQTYPLTGGGIPAGRRGDVIREGIVPAVAGGSFSKGDKLMANTAGKLIAFVGGAGNFIAAEAHEDGADGAVVEVRLLMHYGAT